MKMGGKSIKSTLGNMVILFVASVVGIEDMRQSKCLLFGELVGVVGTALKEEKEAMAYLLACSSTSGRSKLRMRTNATRLESKR